jgi:small subunit ribosomal protein S34
VSAKPGQRNLVELISRFPKQGAGIKVFKKTWPENCYWHVFYTKMSTDKAGRMYGIKYWEGERISNKIDKIPGVMKRGIW